MSFFTIGNDSFLYDEIRKHLETWKTVRQVIQTHKRIGPEEQVFFPDVDDGFIVDGSRPLVSVIARIMPSADLFVGIYDVNLCNASGYWVPSMVSYLFPYDAGTGEKSPNNDSFVFPSNPQQNIFEMRRLGIANDRERGLGFIRLRKLNEQKGSILVVNIDENNCPNEGSRRKPSLVIYAMMFFVIIYFEILG